MRWSLLSSISVATALVLPDNGNMAKHDLIPRSSCVTTGVHMIVARASTEAAGIGNLLAPLVAGVEEYLPGSDAVGVDYPASLVNYGGSIAIGVSNMTKLIESYVSSCPDSKIVLIGYSQGAQVVGDTLCGTSSSGFTQTSALPSKYSNNIIAVIQMGDPSHVVGYSFDIGTASSNGIFPRTSVTGCKQYANRLQSYCDSGDAYCDGGEYLAPHYEYVNNYGEEAAEYICDKASDAGVGTCS